MSLMTLQANQAATALDEMVDVIYLEDDPEMAELYRLKLQADGYRVRIVPLDSKPPVSTSGVRPELLFVDMRLRVQQGIDSITAWRADRRFRNLPAVMLSSVDQAEFEAQGLRLGVLDQLIHIRPAVSEANSSPDWLSFASGIDAD